LPDKKTFYRDRKIVGGSEISLKMGLLFIIEKSMLAMGVLCSAMRRLEFGDKLLLILYRTNMIKIKLKRCKETP
jgi:hypothetical protein